MNQYFENRNQRIVELINVQGLSYGMIAKEVGISRARVAQIYNAMMQKKSTSFVPGRRGRPPKTASRDQLLNFIIAWKSANDGNSPNYGDFIKAGLYKSHSAVGSGLRMLEKLGLLKCHKRGRVVDIHITGARWVFPYDQPEA